MKDTRNSEAQKQIRSDILREKRQWMSMEEATPHENVPYVIRITHPTKIFRQTKDQVWPAEDIKVAIYTNENGWKILPPYPAYDYSILSKRDKLIEDAYVSHFAKPERNELKGWVTRFDLTNQYKELDISVDALSREKVYKALLHAAFLCQASTEEFKEDYTILCDLQATMDKKYGEVNIRAMDDEFKWSSYL